MRRSLYKSLHRLSDQKKYWANRVDLRVSSQMGHYGHLLERWLLGLLFCWFGTLKLMGQFSASSIIAKSIYLFDPGTMVPILGLWEVLIGFFLLVPGGHRVAILLMVLRLLGTGAALILKFDVCFENTILIPTIQGQYLLKEITLLGAALVIGGSVRNHGSANHGSH